MSEAIPQAEMWTEYEFNFMAKPIEKTLELKDDEIFKLMFQIAYLRLKSQCDEEQKKELDAIYQSTDKELQL